MAFDDLMRAAKAGMKKEEESSWDTLFRKAKEAQGAQEPPASPEFGENREFSLENWYGKSGEMGRNVYEYLSSDGYKPSNPFVPDIDRLIEQGDAASSYLIAHRAENRHYNESLQDFSRNLKNLKKMRESLLKSDDYYKQFKDQEEYEAWDFGQNPKRAKERQQMYAEKSERAKALRAEMQGVKQPASGYLTGGAPLDSTPYAYLPQYKSEEERSRERGEKMDEISALETWMRDYERGNNFLTAKVTDDYRDYAGREDFSEKSAAGEYGNASRQDLDVYDLLTDGMHHVGSDGNIYNDTGDMIWAGAFAPGAENETMDYAKLPHAVNDRLGLFLALKKDGVKTDPGKTHGSVEKLLLEGNEGGWESLTEDEVKTYYYLMNTDGKKAADKFLDAMEPVLNKRQAEMEAAGWKQDYENASGLGKLGLSLSTLLTKPVGSAVAFADDVTSMMRGDGANPYTSAHNAMNFSDLIRYERGKDWDEWAGGREIPVLGFGMDDLYQTAMSVGDMFVGGKASAKLFGEKLGAKIYGTLMGMGAAEGEAKKLYEQGASADQIAWGSAMAGAAEGLFEKYSIESLVDIPDPVRKRDIIKNMLKQGGVEASEEVFTEIANIMTNTLIMGKQSDWERAAAEHGGDYGLALLDKMADVVNAGLGGFLSGEVAAGVDSSAKYIAGRMDGSIAKPVKAEKPKPEKPKQESAQEQEAPSITEPAAEAPTPTQEPVQEQREVNASEIPDTSPDTSTDTSTVDQKPVENVQKPIENAAPVGYVSASGAAVGKKGVTYSDAKNKINFRYAAVPASMLTASHDEYGNANPDYPAELQPRDRTRGSSVVQVSKIANNLIPDWLSESWTAQNGSPIVSDHGVVVSGNARTQGILLAYKNGKAENYAKYIRDNAERFGIDPNSVPENPVLVRVVDGGADLKKIASAANTSTITQYSATEQAVEDASRMQDIVGLLNTDEDGDLKAPQNQEFVQAFVSKVVPENQVNDVVRSGFKLSSEGAGRIRNAVFQYAYGDIELLKSLAEDTDPDSKNLITALVATAPAAVSLKDAVGKGSAYDMGVVNTVIEAVDLYRSAREDNQKVEDYAAQGSMFGENNPYSVQLAQFFEENKRSAKQMKTFLSAIYNQILAAGDPKQISTEDKAPTTGDIMRGVKNEYEQKSGRLFTLGGSKENVQEGESGAGEESHAFGRSDAESSTAVPEGNRGSRKWESVSITTETPDTSENPDFSGTSKAVLPDGQKESMGAADAEYVGKTKKTYWNQITDKNSKPDRKDDARPMEVPDKDLYGRKISEVVPNVYGSKNTPDSFIEQPGGLMDMVNDGVFGHDIKHNSESVKEAQDYIDSRGEATARSAIATAAANGTVRREHIAAAAVLFTKYANDKSTVSQENAAEMLADLSMLATQSGRNLQLFKLLRKLTPEGKLMAVRKSAQRYVDSMNQNRSGKNKVEIDKTEEQQKVSKELDRQFMEAAEAEAGAENATEDDVKHTVRKGMEKDAREAAEEAAGTIEERLANRVVKDLKKVAKESEISEEDVIFRDLMKFVNENVSEVKAKYKPEAKSTAAIDTLVDYYQNQQLFQDAWDLAMERAQAEVDKLKSKGEPEPGDGHRIDMLEGFINGTKTPMDYSDVYNPQSALRKGTKQAAGEAGVKMQNASQSAKADTAKAEIVDVLTKNAASKMDAANRITEVIIQRAGVSAEQASEIAADVTSAFFADLAERSQARLVQMFGEKNVTEKVQKTLLDKMEELYNLGAFNSEQYADAAYQSLFGDGVKVPQELMKDYADAAAERRTAAEMAIYENIASQLPGTLKEKWDSWRRMAMLFNAKTQVRNFAGNLMFRPFVTAKRLVGSGLESLLKIPEEQRTKSTIGLSKNGRALLELAKADAKASESQKLMEGNTKTGDIARSVISDMRKIYGNKAMETMRKGLMDFMEKTDDIFKRREYADSLASFLKARGYTAQQWADGKIEESTLNEARVYAARESLKATFNDVNAFSKLVSKRMHGNDIMSKVINYAVDSVFPFRRTPANVVARIYDYSPASIIQGAVQYRKALKDGTISAADAIDRMASGLVGTAAMGLGALLASGALGIKLVGHVDDEDEERTGVQRYSIEIGDSSYTVDWAAPSVVPLFVGANFYNSLKDRGQDVSAFTAALDSLSHTLEPMLELSMLSGLNDVLDAGKYAQEGDKLFARFAAAATGYFMQALPTALGQIDQLGGDRKRVYTESKDPFYRQVQNLLGKATKKIPGVDLYQAEWVDEWGRTDKTNWFEALLSPSYKSDLNAEAADKEIIRLNKAQDKNASPPSASDNITIGGESRRLTGKEWSTLQKEQGRISLETVNKLISLPEYQQLSDTEKALAIRSCYDYAREIARGKVLDWYTSEPDAWMQEAKKDPAQTIVNRAVQDASGLSEAQYANAAEAGFTLDDMKKVSGEVKAALPDSPTAYDKYRAVLDVTGDDAKKWLPVYGLSEGRMEEMAEARKHGISESVYIDYAEASSKLDKAMTNITKAWKNGEKGSLDELAEAYAAFEGLPTKARSYFKSSLGGRVEAYANAMDAGVTERTFVDLWHKYYDLSKGDGMASDNAQDWAVVLDKAQQKGQITGKQRDVLWNDLAFFSMSRQNAVKYNQMSDAGIKPDSAAYVADLLKGVEKTSDQMNAISGSNLSDADKLKAAHVYLDDKQDAKLDTIVSWGFGLDDYAKFYSIYRGNSRKSDTISEYMRTFGFTQAQATAIYEVYNPRRR